jgi:uncharacterized protein (TIGR00369 family)
MDHTPQQDAPFLGTEEAWIAWADGLVTSRALHARCTSFVPGRVELVMDSSPWPTNPNGALHGGLVGAIADHVMGMTAMSVSTRDELPATATLTINYHRPAFPPLTCVGEVSRRGRTLAFIEAEIRSGDGRVCARCSGTWSIDGASRSIARNAAPAD